MCVRKPTIQFQTGPTQTPGFSVTEDGERVEVLHFESRGIVLSV